ncbi:hypothetical protein [Caballeronia sp. J97]|nr:hypothetical protein [Caballeronia sp. J97]
MKLIDRNPLVFSDAACSVSSARIDGRLKGERDLVSERAAPSVST